MTLSAEDVLTQLTPIFREVFEESRLVPHLRMTSSEVGMWDSITHINLILAIEKAFKIQFLTAEIGELEDVGALVTKIMEKVAIRQ